ncbi:MAG: hypothetical protein ACK4PR_13640, partial [Gammaproteobacteria bacterium]
MTKEINLQAFENAITFATTSITDSQSETLEKKLFRVEINWYNDLYLNLKNNVITNDAADQAIRKSFHDHWLLLQLTLSHQLSENDSIRLKFFTHIANLVVHDNEPLIDIFKPGKKVVKPDTLLYPDNESETLRENTEAEENGERCIAQSLVYDHIANTLLHCSNLFEYAYNNEMSSKTFFSSTNSLLTLTDSEKITIKTIFPDACEMLQINWLDSSDFLKHFDQLRDAVFVMSSKGKGRDLDAFVDDLEVVDAVHSFYLYWQKIDIETKSIYSNIECDNKFSLGDNLLRIFTGV